MSSRYTIQDIARRANVGVGTVSRVLNNDDNVKDSTRQRVLNVIEELDYRPSFAARSMRTKRSQIIGFIADEVATKPFAGDIIRGAQALAWSTGRLLLVINTERDPNLKQAAVDMMLERRVEGILYAALYHREVNTPENLHEVPTVLVDCYNADRSLPSVVPNEAKGGRDATEVLLRKGHRRIGFININLLESKLPAVLGRLEGYKAALSVYDVPFDESLLRYGLGTAEDGYRFSRELMLLREPPTAIFCGNDRTAMGAYDALKELGLKIPEDVAMIGFDNQEIIAEALRPPLSTMALPHYEMGRWAVNYLHRLIDRPGRVEPIQQLMACPYIERESV